MSITSQKVGCNRQPWVVLDGKFSQEYLVNAGVPQGSINDSPDDVICDTAIHVDGTNLYFKCDQASGLWQQLELASEIESDLQDTADWGKKWLADFNVGKTQLVLFHWSNKIGSIDVKMNGSVLEEKWSFRMLVLTFSSKMDWDYPTIIIARTASKKIAALISYDVSFSCGCRLSINLPYAHVWNTGVTSGLVPLVATRNC